MRKCPTCYSCLHPQYKGNNVFWFCDFCLDYYKLFKKECKRVFFGEDGITVINEEVIE